MTKPTGEETLDPTTEEKDEKAKTPENLATKHKNARDNVTDFFESQIGDFRKYLTRNPMTKVEVASATNALRGPVDELLAEWIAEEKALAGKGKNPAESLKLVRARHAQAKELIMTMKAYVENLSAEHKGHITAEVLAKLVIGRMRNIRSLNTVIQLQENGQPHPLVGSLRWALGVRIVNRFEGEGGDKEDKDAAKKAAERISEMEDSGMIGLMSELEKNWKAQEGNKKNVMPCVWTVMALMPRGKRYSLATSWLKGKNEATTEKFLRQGAENGVFGPREMRVILGKGKVGKDRYKKMFTEEERENIQIAYKAQRESVESMAKGMTNMPAGSVNAAVSMLSFRNIGMFLLKSAAYTTIATNLIFNIKSPSGMAKSYAPMAGVVAAGLHYADSDESMDMITAGQGTRQGWAREDGRAKIAKALDTRDGEKLHDLFGVHKDFGLVWHYFLQSEHALLDGKTLKDEVKAEDFIAFLDERIAGTTPLPDKQKSANFDYKAIRKQFKDSGIQDLTDMAKGFHSLQKGGDKAIAAASMEKYYGIVNTIDYGTHTPPTKPKDV
jgi:hypothetical protein